MDMIGMQLQERKQMAGPAYLGKVRKVLDIHFIIVWERGYRAFVVLWTQTSKEIEKDAFDTDSIFPFREPLLGLPASLLSRIASLPCKLRSSPAHENSSPSLLFS